MIGVVVAVILASLIARFVLVNPMFGSTVQKTAAKLF